MWQWQVSSERAKKITMCVCVLCARMHVRLLIKMEHTTQSSCEDKSLHLCSFDYPRGVSGHLAVCCSFSERRKLYQSSRHRAHSPAGEQRQRRLAAIQTASSSPAPMTDIAHRLPPVLLCVKIHIISQPTPGRPLTWRQEDVSVLYVVEKGEMCGVLLLKRTGQITAAGRVRSSEICRKLRVARWCGLGIWSQFIPPLRGLLDTKEASVIPKVEHAGETF